LNQVFDVRVSKVDDIFNIGTFSVFLFIPDPYFTGRDLTVRGLGVVKLRVRVRLELFYGQDEEDEG
jgi:hypothetical protein